MITKEKYQEARKIIEEYDRQVQLEEIAQEKERLAKQKEMEDNCEGHVYEYKSGNPNRMKCMNCGKVINK